MSQETEALKACLAEILRVNPSREACLLRLKREGWDAAVAEPAVDEYLAERRRSAKARRQAEEDRSIVLGRLLEGEPAPHGVEVRRLGDLATEKRAGLRRRGRRWAGMALAHLLVALILGGITGAVIHVQGLDALATFWWTNRELPLAFLASGGMATFFFREWRTARRRSRRLEELAREHGWW